MYKSIYQFHDPKPCYVFPTQSHLKLWLVWFISFKQKVGGFPINVFYDQSQANDAKKFFFILDFSSQFCYYTFCPSVQAWHTYAYYNSLNKTLPIYLPVRKTMINVFLLLLVKRELMLIYYDFSGKFQMFNLISNIWYTWW